ncbi:MAG: hypothetical protein WBZ37_30145 [Mycobacterium sp.]
MTNTRSTTHGLELNSTDARRRQIRVLPLIFAGAATVAAFALFGAAQPGSAATVATPGTVHLADGPNMAGIGGLATDGFDGTAGVNDNGQTEGDTFTQNAQDQSTA